MTQTNLDSAIEDALRDILREKGVDLQEDSEIDFTYQKIRKGSDVRTNAYLIRFTDPGSKEDQEIFCKEYIKEGSSPDLSGREKRDIDEEELSKLFENVGGFAVKYYTHKAFAENGQVHNLNFLEKFDSTLEEKLIHLHSAKEKALEDGKKDKAELIEQEAGDWLRRFSDIVIVNNHLLNDKYRKEEIMGSSGSPKIRIFDPVSFANDMRTYLDITLRSILPGEKERREWEIKHRYDKILGLFIDGVADYFDRITDKESVSLTGPYPAHCVFSKDTDLSKPEYVDEDSILNIRDGRKNTKNTPYTGFAICDLTKIGNYHPSLGLMSLYADPAVTRLIPKEKLKPRIETGIEKGGLMDHLMVAQEKIVQNKNIFLEDISPQDQRNLLETYSRASIWALVRKMYFISSLGPERQKELSEARSLYCPEKFVGECIRSVLDIYDPAGNFDVLKKGFEDLEKALTRNPFSSRYN